MVHWGYLILAAVGGAIFGMFVTALMTVAEDDDKNKHKK